VAFLHAGEARALGELVAALAERGGTVVEAAPGPLLEEALRGLCPLGFAGAWIEGEGLEREVFSRLGRFEPEARLAGRVDALACGRLGPEGFFLAPRALANLLERLAYPGYRLLWLGSPRPELALGLRGAGEVSVFAPVPAEAEAMLRALPGAVRGRVVARRDELLPQAAQADVLVYAGGELPTEVVAPYHAFLALEQPPLGVEDAVGRFLAPEAFLAERVRLFLAEVLGL